jgi:inward rectifier potassium channel
VSNDSRNSALETQVFSSEALKKFQEEQLKSHSGDGAEFGIIADPVQFSGKRLLNRDGTFNVHRIGSSIFSSRGLYHYLMNIPSAIFFSYLIGAYFFVNFIFASIYFLLGPAALDGSVASSEMQRFANSFFFSVQTFATIGYGKMSPHGFIANIVSTFEAFIGLLGFALATGLFFARFSRPTARFVFSNKAVIGSYRDKTAFQFRVANQRKNQIIKPEAKVVLCRFERRDGTFARKFYELPLERTQLLFLPLNWTIVHPIDESSPLYGVTEQQLLESKAEFMVLISGTDDTISQQVFSVSSYTSEETIWNAKFKNILESRADGVASIDLRRIHEIE